MKLVSCNYCGSDDYSLVNHGPDLLLDRSGDYTLVRCRVCDLIYQNPRLTLEELPPHYPEEYDPYQEDIKSESSLTRRIDANYRIQRRCRQFMKFAPYTDTLLDVGCATGLFLNAMQEHGWSVAGVELSNYAATYAQETFGLPVTIGTLEHAQFPDSRFNAVTMWDVLEHVIDPKITIAEVYRILQPGGMLALSLPNPASWEARIFGSGWVGWDRPRHLHLFTPTVIQKYLTDAGFTDVHIESLGGRLGLSLLSVEMLLTSYGESGQKWIPCLTWLYNWPLRILTWPAYWLAEVMNRANIMNVYAYKPKKTAQHKRRAPSPDCHSLG